MIAPAKLSLDLAIASILPFRARLDLDLPGCSKCIRESF